MFRFSREQEVKVVSPFLESAAAHRFFFISAFSVDNAMLEFSDNSNVCNKFDCKLFPCLMKAAVVGLFLSFVSDGTEARQK